MEQSPKSNPENIITEIDNYYKNNQFDLIINSIFDQYKTFQLTNKEINKSYEYFNQLVNKYESAINTQDKNTFWLKILEKVTPCINIDYNQYINESDEKSKIHSNNIHVRIFLIIDGYLLTASHNAGNKFLMNYIGGKYEDTDSNSLKNTIIRELDEEVGIRFKVDNDAIKKRLINLSSKYDKKYDKYDKIYFLNTSFNELNFGKASTFWEVKYFNLIKIFPNSIFDKSYKSFLINQIKSKIGNPNNCVTYLSIDTNNKITNIYSDDELFNNDFSIFKSKDENFNNKCIFEYNKIHYLKINDIENCDIVKIIQKINTYNSNNDELKKQIDNISSSYKILAKILTFITNDTDYLMKNIIDYNKKDISTFITNLINNKYKTKMEIFKNNKQAFITNIESFKKSINNFKYTNYLKYINKQKLNYDDLQYPFTSDVCNIEYIDINYDIAGFAPFPPNNSTFVNSYVNNFLTEI